MITLKPNASFGKITKPKGKHLSEFEVQAEIYFFLKSNGFDVRGELSFREKQLSNKVRLSRFDLVIFEGENATHIIEVKNKPVKHKNGVEATRQCWKYRTFGIPVTFVYGVEDGKRFVESLLAEVTMKGI